MVVHALLTAGVSQIFSAHIVGQSGVPIAQEIITNGSVQIAFVAGVSKNVARAATVFVFTLGVVVLDVVFVDVDCEDGARFGMKSFAPYIIVITLPLFTRPFLLFILALKTTLSSPALL